ncbi:putative UPF0481 protein At3g02645 [Fagus crenata]
MMDAIIETKEDVKLLKDHGIFERGSLKDEEVVKIFSGMSKPVRLANPPNIDKAIEEANKYYNGQLEVMTLKFIKKCLRPLWNIIRKFWTAILLFIMAFQEWRKFRAMSSGRRRQQKLLTWGCVYAMDIQNDALENTSLLEESLNPNEKGLGKQLPMCHSKMDKVVPEASVRYLL